MEGYDDRDVLPKVDIFKAFKNKNHNIPYV